MTGGAEACWVVVLAVAAIVRTVLNRRS